MAPELRTTAERILKQKKLHFSCFIRNVTPEAVSVLIEVGKLENEPRLSDEDFEYLMALNNEKVSLAETTTEPENDEQPSDAEPTAADEEPPIKAQQTTWSMRENKPSQKPTKAEASPRKPEPPQNDPDDSATEW